MNKSLKVQLKALRRQAERTTNYANKLKETADDLENYADFSTTESVTDIRDKIFDLVDRYVTYVSDVVLTNEGDIDDLKDGILDILKRGDKQ